MSRKGHVPIRMCMGCRKKRRKEEMMRFIKRSDGVLFTNEKKNLNGRGYYLCPDQMCLKLAQKKNRSMDHLGRAIEGCLRGKA